MADQPETTPPDDHILVPRKPTKAMLAAAEDALWQPSSDRPFVYEGEIERAWDRMIEVWLGERGGEMREERAT